jgi:hypothetical protein
MSLSSDLIIKAVCSPLTGFGRAAFVGIRRVHRRGGQSALALLLAICIGAAPASTALASKNHDHFLQLINQLSEPGGFFDSDNLISNETSYLHVLGKMRELGIQGGVYIGVGPDQNFSYIAKIRPHMVFVIDIRRDNLLQQLMFKSLFSRARNRIEYLCLLFGQPYPKNSGWEQRSLKQLVDYIDNTASSQKQFDKTMAEVGRDARHYNRELTSNDLEVISRVQRAFYGAGLDIRYSTHFRPPRSIYPTFRELLLAEDLSGQIGNYLDAEDDFRFVKKLEDQDLVVPIVGDLSGPRALKSKSLGSYIGSIKEHVSAFYVSNVEFYLSREGTFSKFAENLKSLPIDDRSVIIRSYFNFYAPPHPQSIPGHFSTQLLEKISDLIQQCEAGGCESYSEIVTKNSIALQ